ncbi:docking domain of Afi1 for Arf3 in vesicle trafficking-domain-containing protein [Roridomyces roridus]|uniref:Docking domain of Afi1 for Arf3 in vesicle trafficking-domain-containing protein n=1 Tax=Roridomyces roridus TaxID=1738132 RepID=A0AAD7CDU4_9AGAR|nr:docking domain of Afi1 for Arf3 in vesicle trafficking-domain-containing protein [Roridomyces roridus]
MGSDGGHCSFVLLAEFDILAGAQLKYQFPQPLGVDESVLAMSMLPDGAETQLDDWTIFFLNQTAFNTISPVLALDTPEVKTTALMGEPVTSPDKPDLLCVLNLVRTKHDATLERGARVLALAICTRHPFIQIFKPVLLMALDDYFSNPSQDCLARLFDAINSMDLSGAPILTRNEKMVMRSSERKDIFAEKFAHAPPPPHPGWNSNGRSAPLQYRSTHSGESFSSFEEGILMRNKEKEEHNGAPASVQPTAHSSPSEASFSLGGSAVWVGEESGLDAASGEGEEDDSIISFVGSTTIVNSSIRRRRSTDASSGSSQAHLKDGTLRPSFANTPSYYDTRSGATKDTHFFHTMVAYKDHQLPIKMPLFAFPEEVGDYSLITLIKAFSSQALVTGPTHPHLHTNGPQTHPIIILFNALVTGKRIIFLGHKKPAGEVSSFVLSACALGSGCGAVLRGFIERSFPYANLNNRDEWEAVPAYIAGVTNPIFKSSPTWDLLLDISTGSVTVARDIHATYPIINVAPPLGVPGIARSTTFNTETSLGSEEDISRTANGAKTDFVAKADNNSDNVFIEDIKSAIEYHYGESVVRVRFTEYVLRFVRLASRYEEDTTGTTKLGYPSCGFDSRMPNPRLGSGIVFNDEITGRKDLAANSHRIEAWRKTNSYEYICADFRNAQINDAIQGFDVTHQLFRLRNAKSASDAEVSTIMRALAENVKTYDQVVELLAYLMPHGGGLLHLAFCLFHQKESVRDATVDLFDQIRAYPVGVLFLQALNHFQRFAYVRQAHAREKRMEQQYQPQQQQQPIYNNPRHTYSADRMTNPPVYV